MVWSTRRSRGAHEGRRFGVTRCHPRRQFARTWRRPPTEQELQGLIEDYIRDEIFYREGRAAGLDRDDFIIRRRVRQKMEFLAEDMSGPSRAMNNSRPISQPIRNGFEPRTG